MMQTVLIFDYGDHEFLVRVFDQHVSQSQMQVDVRPNGTMLSQRWLPIPPQAVTFRHEDVPVMKITTRSRDLDYLAELLRQAEYNDGLVEDEVAAGLEAIDRLRGPDV